ncbi:MAG: hypothetical protein LC790_16860, partial [Actinobacteria bacterium]|nr:hypothetical protein [Actinomycetota bacterium]MCA1700471.1 hypothetical protein [Actinomycetota bacterium]
GTANNAICATFAATINDPLPDLGALGLAVAAHCQGIVALADGEPIAGLGPQLLRRARARRHHLDALAARN